MKIVLVICLLIAVTAVKSQRPGIYFDQIFRAYDPILKLYYLLP